MYTGSGLCKKEVGVAGSVNNHDMRCVNGQKDFPCSSVHTSWSTHCLSWMPIIPITWLWCITFSKNKGGIYFKHKLPKIAATLKMTDKCQLAMHSGCVRMEMWIRENHTEWPRWLWLLTVLGLQHCSNRLWTSLCFKGFCHQSCNDAWSVSQIAYKQLSSNSYQNQLIKILSQQCTMNIHQY